MGGGEVDARCGLETPERFAALPKRSEFERSLLIWRYPAHGPYSSWSVFAAAGPVPYFVRRLQYDPRKEPRQGEVFEPDIYGAESPIDAETVDRILLAFAGLQVPVFRDCSRCGLDGVTSGVQIGNDWQGTRVHWWSAYSAQWEPLVRLHHACMETFDGLLPASTLRGYRS